MGSPGALSRLEVQRNGGLPSGCKIKRPPISPSSLREGRGGAREEEAEGRGGGTPVAHGTTPKPPAFCETPTVFLVWGNKALDVLCLFTQEKKKSIGNAIVSILRGRRPLLRPSLNILFILIFVSMCMTVHVSECTHVCVCMSGAGSQSRRPFLRCCPP